MIMELNVNEHYINSQLSSQSFEPVFKNLSLTTISLHALKYSRHWEKQTNYYKGPSPNFTSNIEWIQNN